MISVPLSCNTGLTMSPKTSSPFFLRPGTHFNVYFPVNIHVNNYIKRATRRIFGQGSRQLRQVCAINTTKLIRVSAGRQV